MNSELKTSTPQRLTTNNARNEGLGEAVEKDAPTGPDVPSTRTISLPIHFIKSSSFRVIHASAAWFGGDAQQNLHLTFYNERTPIPKTLVVKLDEQGMIVGEDTAKRESKLGVVREVEVDVIFSIPSAVDFYKMLGENLKALKAI